MLIQTAIIAVAVGLTFRHTPAATPAKVWPYLLFGYATLGILFTWILGGVTGYLDDEFTPRSTILLGVLYALPVYLASGWLSASPYHVLGVACQVFAALWVLHLLVTIGMLFKNRTA